jgi:hypothetical protein
MTDGEGQTGPIEAQAAVLRTGEGRRRYPMFSGHRSDRREAGSEEPNRGVGHVDIAGAYLVAPVETGNFTIETTPWSRWPGLEPGSSLETCEGTRRLARGTATRVESEPTVDR